MDNPKDISHFNPLIDRFAYIKEKYGDNHPIIFFEPNIEMQEKNSLKNLIEGIPSIQLFQELPEAFQFVQSLDISFILLFTCEYNEDIILQNFKDLNYIINRRMPISEENILFQSLFKEISSSIITSLKAFLFISPLDFLTKTSFSYFDGLIEKFTETKEKYGDEYPLVFYEPNIEVQAKQDLKCFIEGNSSIQLFSELESAEKYIKSLGISFVLIFSREYNEYILLQPFKNFEFVYHRRMFDFEEEAFLKVIFKETPDSFRKSLRVYVFVTLREFLIEMPEKENDEEVMIMCDVKKMAQDFRQEFTIICYDPLMSSEAKEKLEKDIEISIQDNNCYTNFDELQKRLKDWKDSPPYHLILSGETEAQKIIDQINDFKDLLGLYIYCDFSGKINNEKIDVQKTLNELIPKIKEGIRTRSKLKHTFPAFATNFDASDKSYFYNTHHYLKRLVHFKNRKQAKEDFVKLARKIYQDKESELIKFEKNYDQYNEEQILSWYTRDSPIYKLINNCLRISSLDSILYCRFILKDVETAIREKYQQKNKDFNGEVYRGAYLSMEEWEKLQRNIGEEIEMYGFLSTTAKKRAALNFLKADLQNKVLITIIVPPLPELDEQGFADISEFSEFKGEKEILFNVRSRFKIIEAQVSKVDERLGKCRHLVLLYGAQSLRKYTTKNQPTIKIELTLPSSELKCSICGSKDSLFGFDQGKTEICCKDCLQGDSAPRNIPFLALDMESASQTVTKSFRGQFLKFDQPVNLPQSCSDCKGASFKRYYKRVTLDGSKTISECSECFEKNDKRGFDILLLEESPYMLWQEEQTEWEKVDSNFQERPEQKEIRHQIDIYMEVQEFTLCENYGKTVICRWNKKRAKEGERLRMYYRIGEAHYKLRNNQEALKYLFQTLDIRKEVFGEKNFDNSILFSLLGLVHQDLGEYQQALDYHTKAVDISTAIFGEKGLDTVASYTNIGLIYFQLGEHQKALEYFFKTLETYKENYGEQHPEIALLYNHFGKVYCRLGAYQEALKYEQRALDINKAIYGEKHRRTASSYDSIAVDYRILGQYQQALDYHKKALGVFMDLSGEKSLQTASSYNHLATVYHELGQSQQAMDYFFKALEIRKAIHGEKHSETATSYNNIAVVYQSLGENEQALKYFFKALAIVKDIYGEKHLQTATTYHNIGAVYMNLEQARQALEYQKKALDVFKEIYGEKHPDIAASYNLGGQAYQRLGETQQALDYYKKALDISKDVFGENHTYLVTSYNNLGSLYRELGNSQQALDSSQKGLDLCIKIYGENHDLTATSYENIGAIYQSLGKEQQALEYWEKTLQIRKIVFGENNLHTAASYTCTAWMYQKLGQYQQALDHHKRARDIFRNICGEKHSHTLNSHAQVLSLCKKLGQNDV